MARDNSGNASVTFMGPESNGGNFSIGTTELSYDAQDNAGNRMTCAFTINVTDMEKPTISCPDDISTTTTPGMSTGQMNWTLPEASDNSGNVNVIRDTNGTISDIFPIGISRVWYTAMDDAGNTNNCSFAVTINDNERPNIICPEDYVGTNDPGLGSAEVTWSMPRVWDNSGEVTVTLEGPATNGTNFTIGSTTVQYTATDAAGNTQSCSFQILITDGEAPSLICPESQSVPTSHGLATASVFWMEPSARDNSGSAFVTFLGPGINGGNFSIGTTELSYDAQDNAGNRMTCSFTVYVTDMEEPTISCPDNISTTTTPGMSTGLVNWTLPEASDNSGNVNVIRDTNGTTADIFPIGISRVWYTALDDAGNRNNCSFVVTIIDKENPVITCIGPPMVYTDSGLSTAVVTWTEPTVADNSGSADVSLVGPGVNGGRFSIGKTNVTYRGTDAAGNSDECVISVRVIDNENPMITCPNSTTATTQPGLPSREISWNEPSATDNSGNVTVCLLGPTVSGGNFSIGSTTVTYRVEDPSGNSAQCSFDVHIKDEERPVIEGCPGSLAVTAQFGSSEAVATWEAPTATDNSNNVTIAIVAPGENGGDYPLGNTSVSYVAVDGSGNNQTCEFIVTVAEGSICDPNPCLNGGTCIDFSNIYICRCPSGYEGRTCESARASCESDMDCVVSEECVSSSCQCRPNFIRRQETCIAQTRYSIELTILAANGVDIDYTLELANESSELYTNLTETIIGVILATTTVINDVTVTEYRQGSVIAVLDSFVNTSTSFSTVEADVLNNFGDETLTAGLASIRVEPEATKITDADECASDETNDCSPNAVCANTEGSFTCQCYESYVDLSADGSGRGKICEFSQSVVIGAICGVILFIIVIVAGGAILCWKRRVEVIGHAEMLRKMELSGTNGTERPWNAFFGDQTEKVLNGLKSHRPKFGPSNSMRPVNTHQKDEPTRVGFQVEVYHYNHGNRTGREAGNVLEKIVTD
ncbi:hyalin-like [Diadema setosum]|uniref:hyalin-like n=1 Tax=Diadema setosum TaxID=31175 RepID=UPI003B3A7BC4